MGEIDNKEIVVALAGNPNVGKSTVFNALTGLNQHTGNWPGKTVTNARGKYTYNGKTYTLVDIPGTYSLMASSAEEEVARDFICFGEPDVTIVVADATCLERNLNLLLQILEVTPNVVFCVNLMDEAKKKKIEVNISALSAQLKIPVVGTSARSGKGLKELIKAVESVAKHSKKEPMCIHYDIELESAIASMLPTVTPITHDKLPARFVALKLLDEDATLNETMGKYLQADLSKINIPNITIPRDRMVLGIVQKAEKIYQRCVTIHNAQYNERDRKIDKILTSKATGIPVMLIMLGIILWLTITGANYPSQLLSELFAKIGGWLQPAFTSLGSPEWLTSILFDGVYRTLTWVIAVMLPPMAIFFPLFTLLEDLGYLPRIAFNMDRCFKKAHAHGKQALTMCIVCIILLIGY